MDGPPKLTKHSMQKPLHTIADIRTGHTFRKKIEFDPAGEISVLQLNEFGRGGRIDASVLQRIQWKWSGPPPVLAEGEIVLPARGVYEDAAIALGNAKIVPTNQFLLIRVHAQVVTPDYLCWYLNQSAARNHFLANRRGTKIPMLSKQALGALPVAVPSMQAQQKIVALHHLSQDERRLTEQLLRNRETMLTGIWQRLLES
jgi:hypothetical protein